MKRTGRFLSIAMIGWICWLWIPALTPYAHGQETKQESATSSCQSCHSGHALGSGFAASVHGNNSCTSCHTGIVNIVRHSSGEQKPNPVKCSSCHREITAGYRTDVHALLQNMTCQDCHQEIHTITRSSKPAKNAASEKCSQCHNQKDYALLGHGKAVLAGNPDSAGCTDCHNLHSIPYYDKTVKADVAAKRETYTNKCKSCHADEKIAGRNKMSTAAARSYDQTYHGKLMFIGFPERVAGCPDCHTGHNTLPRTNPQSTLYPDNIYGACKNCHKIMHKRFVSIEAHPSPANIKTRVALSWTKIFMIALLTGTFSFFWLHTFLWWRKSYLDKCLTRQAGFAETALAPECREDKQIQRFSITDRIMHILLILAFFTLVMTGFPLKYHETAWAKVLMNMWGNPHLAGIFHRSAALVLCGLFLYTMWLSIRFLFPGWQFRGWLKRLFGPDSLFPNWKDAQDIKKMFLWFFGKGPLPRLDRWTYWEKFDFLAVFWGMTAIGFSGFMLWMPGIFSYIFPGWMINVASIVHSEEAFLAAVFIFTVHFFNNHLVPNKFPLEPNIFTGRYRLEALREERPLEYERLIAENRLDKLKREGPGLWTQLFASVFGLASLMLGLLLLGLIFWAALFY
jgi:cytochrome b subunit of formate dehydrogenase